MLVRSILCISLLISLSACGGDDGPATGATQPQGQGGAAGSSTSSGGAAGASSAGAGGAAAGAAQGGEGGAAAGAAQGGEGGAAGAAGAACVLPAAKFGDDPKARSFAQSPAQCGQAPFVWTLDKKLGQVTASKAGTSYKVGLLTSLAASLGNNQLPPPKHDVKTSKLTYTTQDRGVLLDATAAVAWPTDTAPGEQLKMIVVLHGTAGFKDGCGPSADTESLALLAYIASLGYVAVGPDYIGLRADDGATGFPHPYLVGQPTAIASIDAMRAAMRHVAAQEEGPCPLAQVVVVGGSQGGHAAFWVDRLMPYYAGELTLAGTVATVPPMDMVGEATRALREPVDATLNTAALYTVASPWYGVGDRLSEVFVSPFDVELPKMLAAECDPSMLPDVTTLPELFTPLVLDAAQAGTLADLEPWGCILRENGLTTTSVERIGPSAPGYGIFVITGEADKLVHTPLERDAYAALCTAGLPMQYLECAGAAHTKATTWALPEILQFAADRHEGKPFTPSCEVTAPTRCAATPDM